MKTWRTPEGDDKFEMTPMIDVVFLLITFFMTVTSYASAELIQVAMPNAPEAKVPDDVGDRQFLSISETGTFFLGAFSASLEDIKKLLVFVNGNPESREDDIIPESELYSHFCEIVFDEEFSFKTVERLVKRVTENFKEKYHGSKQRLEKALEIICMNHLANNLLNKSQRLLEGVETNNIFGQKI